MRIGSLEKRHNNSPQVRRKVRFFNRFEFLEAANADEQAHYSQICKGDENDQLRTDEFFRHFFYFRLPVFSGSDHNEIKVTSDKEAMTCIADLMSRFEKMELSERDR